MKHSGSCHCGLVQFTIEAPQSITVQHCNCSMCAMVGFVHLIVAKDAFTLQSGADQLTTYRFNTHVAKHLFCRTCGVKSFYVPRSNPDGYSINFNCLDPSTFKQVIHQDFDGQNWERNAHSLAHLSKQVD